ncbi:MAG: DJ-1/PfpI family protein [Candidatus Saganbacteria bacterium]|nr:DJ-1/PfpI family protein [Candidatus Saganbacteria bacterium]
MKKKVVMIIAFDGFRDEEYFKPKAVLEAGGIEIKSASTQLGNAKGKLGASAPVDLLINDIALEDFDAVIFIGGPGSYNLFNCSAAHSIAKETLKENKVLAAICAAPSILANAGVLKGKRATCYIGEGPHLKVMGVNYTGKGLEIDGNIITADGPAHAKQFGEAILKKLNEK